MKHPSSRESNGDIGSLLYHGFGKTPLFKHEIGARTGHFHNRDDAEQNEDGPDDFVAL